MGADVAQSGFDIFIDNPKPEALKLCLKPQNPKVLKLLNPETLHRKTLNP